MKQLYPIIPLLLLASCSTPTSTQAPAPLPGGQSISNLVPSAPMQSAHEILHVQALTNSSMPWTNRISIAYYIPANGSNKTNELFSLVQWSTNFSTWTNCATNVALPNVWITNTFLSTNKYLWFRAATIEP